LRTNPAPNAPCAQTARLGRWLLVCLAVSASGALGGCVAVAGGAMVGGATMVVDRRSTGTQIDDQTIELRASSAVTGAIGDRGNVSATSYNRVVLLTGEVPTEADRAKVEAAVAKVENVRAVVNELAVMPNSSMTQRTNDSIATGKVKAALFDTKGLQAAAIKVVTDRGNVYLMGRVTETESTVAGNTARGVSGVGKVIKVFEIITPAELAQMPAAPAPAAAPASAAKP
jgi:osmotically-inducible protein OsmY